MPTERANGVRHYDVHDPEDMAELIRTGLIWKGGPNSQQLAVEYLQENPEAMNDLVPANIRAIIEVPEEEPEPVAPEELDMAPPAADEVLPDEEAPLAPPAP